MMTIACRLMHAVVILTPRIECPTDGGQSLAMLTTRSLPNSLRSLTELLTRGTSDGG